MPKGKHLSNFEKGQIMAFHHECWGLSSIADELGRSRTVIGNFLRNPDGYGAKKRSGRPQKLSKYHQRRIIREATVNKLGSKGIVKALQLTVSPRTVRRMLHGCSNLSFKKVCTTPAMQKRHMLARERWALQKVTWTAGKWGTIAWSDEKKFNLDGPDGFAYYWHDLRREPEPFSKRQNGGDSLMVWGAFAGTKKSKLVILNGKQDGAKYLKTLQDYLVPFADDLPVSWTFMQDGAPCHRANIVKDWFEEEDFRVLDWPAYSPDLNPIENLWGILARKVYGNQRQFECLESLEECVMEAWDNIGEETLRNLVSSMQRRCTKVLQSKGKKIDY